MFTLSLASKKQRLLRLQANHDGVSTTRARIWKLKLILLLFITLQLTTINAAFANTQSGIASIYSTDSGSKTASGVRLNPGALTAAHRSLPFGSKVRVINHRNGRSVVVTINDRGPFVRGRIIDLTPAAAQAQVTFTKDVAPILQNKCQVCHRPETFAPMSLLTFEDVRPWAKAIKERVMTRMMPPWYIDKNVGIRHFKDDPSLSDEFDQHGERRTFGLGQTSGNFRVDSLAMQSG